MKPRYVIYVDTNLLFRDHYWTSPDARILRALALRDGVEVWFSPVVVEERARHRRKSLEGDLTSARRAVRVLANLDGADRASAALEQYVAATRGASEDIANRIYAEPWARVLSWPTPTAEELVRRELATVPPFSPAGVEDEGQVAKGYRDTMLWLGLLDAMEGAPRATFMFVSNDTKAFASKEALRPELLTELAARGNSEHSLRHFTSIVALAKDLHPLVRKADGEELETILSIALWAEGRSRADLVGTWDASHETWSGLGLDLGIPVEGSFEAWHYEVESVARLPDSPAAWIVRGTVWVSGAFNKWDYYDWKAEGTADLDIADEINDHYFLVEGSRDVEAILTVELTGEGEFEVEVMSARAL